MIKRILALVVAFGLSLVAVPSNHAETKNFVVSATVPAATGVAINVSRVNATNQQFTPITGTALGFGQLTLNTTLGIYLPSHYFAIDIGALGGAGTPDVTVNYTEGANPNGTRKGLGWKSTATFVKVTQSGATQTEVPLTLHGPKKLLKDLAGESITDTEIAGGFFRMYVGIFSGATTGAFPDPTSGEPFTNADAPGNYEGTLVVTATIS